MQNQEKQTYAVLIPALAGSRRQMNMPVFIIGARGEIIKEHYSPKRDEIVLVNQKPYLLIHLYFSNRGNAYLTIFKLIYNEKRDLYIVGRSGKIGPITHYEGFIAFCEGWGLSQSTIRELEWRIFGDP